MPIAIARPLKALYGFGIIGSTAFTLPVDSYARRTQVLSQIESGDAGAAQRLLEVVLRQLAAAKMSREKPGQTLQATALVHEANLRLVHSSGQRWDSRKNILILAQFRPRDRDHWARISKAVIRTKNHAR